MAKPAQGQCGKCGAEIDESRRIDYTLQDGTRVCDSCFVRERLDNSPRVWSTEDRKVRGWELSGRHLDSDPPKTPSSESSFPARPFLRKMPTRSTHLTPDVRR